MKTRIFSIIPVILFAAVTTAEATNNRIHITSTLTTEKVNTLIPVGSVETVQLAEWITSRVNWEQEGQEMVSDNAFKESLMLEEWITSRENWENEGQEMVSDNAFKESLMLEEWITGRETWENGGQEMVNDNVPEKTSMMEQWIAGRENWEQI